MTSILSNLTRTAEAILSNLLPLGILTWSMWGMVDGLEVGLVSGMEQKGLLEDAGLAGTPAAGHRSGRAGQAWVKHCPAHPGK